jgi:homospermidine synthase
MMELGRRAASDPALIQEVSSLIRAPENRRRITVGTTSVSQLGAAGLVAGGGENAIGLAAELVQEWTSDEQSDFAWLMKSAGVAWP